MISATWLKKRADMKAELYDLVILVICMFSTLPRYMLNIQHMISPASRADHFRVEVKSSEPNCLARKLVNFWYADSFLAFLFFVRKAIEFSRLS